MDTNEKIIRNFFDGWGDGRMMEVFDQYIHDDCQWYNSGMPPAQGKAACMEFIKIFFDSFPKITAETKALATRDDVVMAERVDHTTLPGGEAGPKVEINGSFRVKDGKIIYWYDYFDPTPFMELLGG